MSGHASRTAFVVLMLVDMAASFILHHGVRTTVFSHSRQQIQPEHCIMQQNRENTHLNRRWHSQHKLSLRSTELCSTQNTWMEEPETKAQWMEPELTQAINLELNNFEEAYAEFSATEVSEMQDYAAQDELSVSAARALIIFSALLCGTNFAAVKLLQESTDPSMVSAARFLIAAVVTSPLLMSSEAAVVWPAVESGVWLAIGYGFQAFALKTAAAGTTAFLCSLTVVICPIIEHLTGKRVSAQAWAAAALAVGGAGFLELSGSELPGIGDVFGVLQAVSFGIFFWKTEDAMRNFPNQALAISTWQAVVCAVGAIAWAVVDAHGTPDLAGFFEVVAHNGSFDAALMWVALVSTALMHVLETIAMGKLPSSETTVIFSTEPLWGAAFASLLLGEQIGQGTAIGGSLIIAACIGRVVDINRVRRQARVASWAARRKAGHLQMARGRGRRAVNGAEE